MRFIVLLSIGMGYYPQKTASTCDLFDGDVSNGGIAVFDAHLI